MHDVAVSTAPGDAVMAGGAGGAVSTHHTTLPSSPTLPAASMARVTSVNCAVGLLATNAAVADVASTTPRPDASTATSRHTTVPPPLVTPPVSLVAEDTEPESDVIAAAVHVDVNADDSRRHCTRHGATTTLPCGASVHATVNTAVGVRQDTPCAAVTQPLRAASTRATLCDGAAVSSTSHDTDGTALGLPAASTAVAMTLWLPCSAMVNSPQPVTPSPTLPAPVPAEPPLSADALGTNRSNTVHGFASTHAAHTVTVLSRV